MEKFKRSENGEYAVTDLLGGLAQAKMHLGTALLKSKDQPLNLLEAEVTMHTLKRQLDAEGNEVGEYLQGDYTINTTLGEILNSKEADKYREHIDGFFEFLQEYFHAELCGEHIVVPPVVEPVDIDPEDIEDFAVIL